VRVLFSSTSGYGHVFPMLPLAKAFLAEGHDVLWGTGVAAGATVSAAGIATARVGLSGDALRELGGLVRGEGLKLDPEARAAFVFPKMFGATFTPAAVADLLPVASEFDPDLMIHENGELAAPLVAAVLDRPSVTHAFGGAIPAAFLDAAGEQVAGLWSDHGLEVPAHAGCFRSGYLDICPPSVQSVPAGHIAGVVPLRPVPDGGTTIAAGVETADDEDGRPLVYVTLGTVASTGAVLRTLLDGIAELPVRVLAATGPGVHPEELGTLPDHVRVEQWVDQARVLEQVDVVVSHAGSGTFLGALSHGLPQPCMPQGADQFRNAVGGRRAGAVLVFHPEEATPTAVGEAVSRLLVEPSFREAAVRVAAEISSMPSPGEVARLLAERFRPG
jgi:UDP:flavonoid glycosyltransferase YjiC (YdhE family)